MPTAFRGIPIRFVYIALARRRRKCRLKSTVLASACLLTATRRSRSSYVLYVCLYVCRQCTNRNNSSDSPPCVYRITFPRQLYIIDFSSASSSSSSGMFIIVLDCLSGPHAAAISYRGPSLLRGGMVLAIGKGGAVACSSCLAPIVCYCTIKLYCSTRGRKAL